MANPFSDLIPQQAQPTAQAGGGNPFADLIPQGETTTRGVTIAPKGGDPRRASPQEVEEGATFRRGAIFPVGRNMETGEKSLALPEILEPTKLPGQVYRGEVDLNSPEGIQQSMGLAGLMTGAAPAARTVAPRIAAPAAKTPALAKSRAPAPTTDELKDMGSQLFERAREIGMEVATPSVNRFAGGLVHKLQKEGIDPDVFPAASAAAKRVSQLAGKQMTLQDAVTLRKVMQGAGKSQNAEERRLVTIMIDRLDDWMGEVTPKDVIAGDPKAAIATLREARSLWSRMKKSELLDEVQERALDKVGANYTQAELQTAVRQELKSLLRSKTALRGWNKAEKAALRRVVRGGVTENILRGVGKFAPRGSLGTVLSVGAGYGVGGPFGAVGLPVAGELAKRASGSMSAKRFGQASDLVRRGGQ